MVGYLQSKILVKHPKFVIKQARTLLWQIFKAFLETRKENLDASKITAIQYCIFPMIVYCSCNSSYVFRLHFIFSQNINWIWSILLYLFNPFLSVTAKQITEHIIGTVK